MTDWTAIKYETLKWESTGDLQHLSRSSRKKILSTYQSSLPNLISDKNVILPAELDVALSDLMLNLARFDLLQSQKDFSFPAILLRSESAASSQIENLTSASKNIALAELSAKAPQNAQLIAGNIAAMRTAIETPERLSISTILKIHEVLMAPSPHSLAGSFRNQAVWIGGQSYSPHEAIFVPPHHSHIDYYMRDLIAYANRIDVNPLVKAAIIHAQFETIHPFVDGNVRTGRSLIHKSLKDDGALQTITLPLSAGLLNTTNEYMDSLKSFQNGNPLPIIQQLFRALELYLLVAKNASRKITLIFERWEALIDEKKTSSIWKFLHYLVEQPVVNSAYISDKLDISIRGANKLINRAIEYGILRPTGTERRGIFYQSAEILSVLDEIPDLSILRRN